MAKQGKPPQGPDDDVAQAVALLADDDPDVRRDGAEQLSDLGTEAATVAMIDALHRLRIEDDGATIGYLVAVLGERREVRAADAIIAVLDEVGEDDEDELAAIACEALAAMDAKQALPVLRDAWREARWPGAVEELAAALGALGSAKDEALLLATLDSEGEPHELVAALGALQRVGGPKAAKVAKALHDHEDLEVAATARVTGAVLDPAQRRALATALGRTRDHAERAELLTALGRAAHPELIGLLMAVVETPAWRDVRFEALAALVEIRDDRVAAVLRRIWDAAATPPWQRLYAGALLVAVAPDGDVLDAVIELFATLTPPPPDDGGAWNEAREAGETAIACITPALASDRPRLLRWAALLDDARRERRTPHPALRDIAADALRDVVGSDRFDDYERWRS